MTMDAEVPGGLQAVYGGFSAFYEQVWRPGHFGQSASVLRFAASGV